MGLILDPSETADGQSAEHGWNPGKLEHELGKKSSERGVADGDGIVKGVPRKPNATTHSPNGSIRSEKAAVGKAVILTHGTEGSATRRGR